MGTLLHCEAPKDASRSSEIARSVKKYWRYTYVIDWPYRRPSPVLNVAAP
jgi:hypothetical protein